MSAYYNEFDPYAAQWLRNLIAAGHIAPGYVDERSISDVHPDDLQEFTQCHFFAGVGVWSLALRRAGWPDSRPVWTASCPCQPFSAAGAAGGFADERHLWPDLFHLITQRQPPILIGEQVAAKAVEPWVDLVHADMEALGYAFGAVPFPSAGVGAPHIRDRLYWVANSNNECQESPGFASGAGHLGGSGNSSGGVDNADDTRPQGHAGHGGPAGREGQVGSIAATGVSGGLANTDGEFGGQRDSDAGRRFGGSLAQSRPGFSGGSLPGSVANADGLRLKQASFGGVHHEEYNPEPRSNIDRAGPTNGLWGSADWLYCRDGKWRAVEPGTFPLANGAASRVGRLRAYGNAVNAAAAQAFIECVM